MAQIAFSVTTVMVLTQVVAGGGGAEAASERNAQPREHRHLPRASWDNIWHLSRPAEEGTVGTNCKCLATLGEAA